MAKMFTTLFLLTILLIPTITLASWDFVDFTDVDEIHQCEGEFTDEDGDGICDECGRTEDECNSHECKHEESSEEVHCEGGVCTVKKSD